MQKNNLYILAFIILLLILAVFFLGPNKSEDEEDLSDENTIVTGDAVITEIPLDSEGTPLLDLDRPIPSGASGPVRAEIINSVESLRDNPKEYGQLLNYGNALRIAGDTEGAIMVWVYMSDLFPTDHVSYINQGDLYHFDLKDHPKSESAYKQALIFNPKIAQTYLKLAELYTLSYTQKIKDTEGILLEGLRQLPSDLGILAALGEYYELSGEKKNAELRYKNGLDEAKSVGDTNSMDYFQSKLNSL